MPQFQIYQPNLSLRPVRTPVESAQPVVDQAKAISTIGASISKAGVEASKLYGEYEERSLRREASAYVSDSLSTFQLGSIQKLQDLRGSVPVEQYQSEFEKFYEAEEKRILDDAPSDYAKQSLVEPMNSLRTSLFSKAILYSSEETIAQQRVEVQRSVDNIAATAFLDPANFKMYRDQTLAVIHGGLSDHGIPPSQLMEYQDKVLGDLSVSYVRSLLDSSPEAAEKALRDLEISSSLSGSQRLAVMNGIQSAREQRARQGLEMQHKASKAFMDDPASLAIMNGADPSDPQDMLSKQFIQVGDQLINVPDNRKSVMTKDQASLLADQFNKLNTPEEAVALVQSIQEKYKDASGVAFRDLASGGLPGHYKTLLAMDPVQDVGAFSFLFRATRDGEKKVLTEAKAYTASRGDEPLRPLVQQSLTPELLTAISMENGDPQKLVDSANLIASYAVVKGFSVNEAISLGTKWITDKYDTPAINNHPVRVNRSLPVEEVTGYLENYVKSYDYSKVTANKAMYDVYKSMASFILDSDAKGYIMVDDLGIPLRTRAGENVYVPITDIANAPATEALDSIAKRYGVIR